MKLDKFPSVRRFDRETYTRSDAWVDYNTGMGTTKDRSAGAYFYLAPVLDDWQLEALYYQDDLCKKIVETKPKEALRRGYEIVIAEDEEEGDTLSEEDEPEEDEPEEDEPEEGEEGEEEEGEEDEEAPVPSAKKDAFPEVPDKKQKLATKGQEPLDPKGKLPAAKGEEEEGGEEKKEGDDAKLIRKALEKFDFDEKILDAWIYARVFGGCAIIVGADDLRLPEQPLNRENIRSIKFLNVIDRRSIYPVTYYQDPLDVNYGQPEIYQVVNSDTGHVSYVHETRVIKFYGTRVDRKKKKELKSWSYSVLQSVYNVLQQFGSIYGSVGVLVGDASQGVFKIDGLIDMIAGGQKDLLQTRMELVDSTRSASRSIMVDAEHEEFTKVNTTYNGLADLLTKFEHRLAAAAEMPLTLLLGMAPAGLNATGDSDVRHFYDDCASERDKTLLPKMHALIDLICLAKDGPTGGEIPDYEIKFPPMWQPTEAEQAATRKAIADTDKVYVDMGALRPEEVAIARFGLGEYSDRAPKVDTAGLKEQMAQEKDFEAANGGPQALEMAKAQQAAEAGGFGGPPKPGEEEGGKPGAPAPQTAKPVKAPGKKAPKVVKA